METQGPDSTKTLTIVMPFLNEAATLRSALERLLSAELPVNLEAILVDDGSTDGGADSVADLVDGQRVVLIRKEHGGKGSAVREGINAAGGDLLGILDADLEYDPQDLGALLIPLLLGEASVVYGTRAKGRSIAFSRVYALGNWATSVWASVLFRTRLSDIHTCLKVAPLALWRALDLRTSGFEFDSEVTAGFLRAGHAIVEVPASYAARSRAAGKKLYWIDGVRTIATLTRVRISPRNGSADHVPDRRQREISRGSRQPSLDETPP